MVCWSSWVPVAWQITCQPPLRNRGSDNTCTYTGDGCNTDGNGVVGPALGEAGCRHTRTASGLSESPGVGDAGYNATQYDLSVHLAMKRSVCAANCSLLPIAAATTYPLHEIVTYGRSFGWLSTAWLQDGLRADTHTCHALWLGYSGSRTSKISTQLMTTSWGGGRSSSARKEKNVKD